jgi:hypothetical protein
MPPTSPAGEEVVEKRASAPVSTACLIIACAALLGGIIFQVLEIAEYRSGTGDPKDMAAKRYKADVRKLDEQVEEILSKAASSGAPTDAAPGAPTDTAPGAPTDTAPETPSTDPGAGDEAEPAGEPAPDAGGDAPAEEDAGEP